jgi:chemosensory pili system protein ChpA (sensor histidine kinase/response regulator)
MSKKRVLVVDDEAVVIRVLKLVLERAGYEVESRSNGQAALERILEQTPDVLITDIEMPRMTGEELCKQIDERFPGRDYPIFVATSVTAMEHRVWSSKIPRLIFLEKPLSARKLLAALAEYFEASTASTAILRHVQ